MSRINFHYMTDADKERQSLLDAQNRYEEDRCQCKKPEGFTLEIDCGSISIVHVQCGKQPWFMFDDCSDGICMGPINIRVEQLTGCHSGICDSPLQMGCDCEPEITLYPEGKISDQ